MGSLEKTCKHPLVRYGKPFVDLLTCKYHWYTNDIDIKRIICKKYTEETEAGTFDKKETSMFIDLVSVSVPFHLMCV